MPVPLRQPDLNPHRSAEPRRRQELGIVAAECCDLARNQDRFLGNQGDGRWLARVLFIIYFLFLYLLCIWGRF